INAQNNGWDTEQLKFKVVDTIAGAETALIDGTADYFMWERFTTKAWVDKGVFRRIADCPTPWPCFVVAATDRFIREQPGTLRHILEIINIYTSDFKNIPSIYRTLSNTYDQKLEDIQHWLSLTRWSQKNLDVKILSAIQGSLIGLKLIDRVRPAKDLIL